MKKIFLGLCILSFTSVSFAQTRQSDVISAISHFKEKANAATLTTELQRSWWQAILNVVSVVAADVGGAYAGVAGTIHVAGAVGLATGGTGVAIVAGVAGVIGAAGASNLAYQAVHRGAADQINYGNLNIVLPKKYSFYALTGKTHNEVLHNNFFHGENLSGYYCPILDAEQTGVIESNETQQTFDFLKNMGYEYASSGFDFDNFSDELINRGLMTTTGKEILNAFLGKYKTCASPRDMEALINLSIEKIDESDIDSNEKLSLIAALMVASESPFYQNPRP